MVLFVVAAGCVALLLANICVAQPNADVPLTVAVGEVSRCPEFSDTPVRLILSKFRVDHKDGDMYINSTFVLGLPLDGTITLRFEFYKCVEKSIDSCSLQGFTEVDTICDEIDKRGMEWTPFIERLKDFAPKCPVPAGSYDLVDGPITKAIRESGMKFDPGHWLIKANMVKDYQAVACMWGYGEVKPKRRETSKNAKGK